MSQENVDIVRQIHAGNRSDRAADSLDEIISLFHPDCEFVSAMGAVDQQTYRGHDGLRRYRRDLEAAWTEWQIEIEEIFEPSPGTVVSIIRPHLVARESGIALVDRRATVTEFADGQIIRVSAHASRAEALEAIGLPE